MIELPGALQREVLASVGNAREGKCVLLKWEEEPGDHQVGSGGCHPKGCSVRFFKKINYPRESSANDL